MNRNVKSGNSRVMVEKDCWLDNLRAIATISVICLHVSAPVVQKFKEIPLLTWQIGNLFDSAVRFCVPVFFMISGALILNRDYEIKEFLRKRIYRIVLPFLFWSVIYVAYNTFVSGTKSVALSDFFKKLVIGLLHGAEYHLWFIYVLIGLYLFLPILRAWVKSASELELRYFILIWLVTILYGAPGLNSYLPNISLLNFSGYIGYFVLGYYLFKYGTANKYLIFGLIIVGFLSTVLGTLFASKVQNGLVVYFYNYLTFNVAINSAGMFLLIKNYEFKSKMIRKGLAIVSKHSFGIYLSHVLVLSELKKGGLYWKFANPIISIPITTIACLLISTLILFLLSKNRFLSRAIG